MKSHRIFAVAVPAVISSTLRFGWTWTIKLILWGLLLLGPCISSQFVPSAWSDFLSHFSLYHSVFFADVVLQIFFLLHTWGHTMNFGALVWAFAIVGAKSPPLLLFLFPLAGRRWVKCIVQVLLLHLHSHLFLLVYIRPNRSQFALKVTEVYAIFITTAGFS